MKRLLLCVIIEVLGIGAVGAGIGVEIALGADLGYVLITAGSLGVAGGGLIFAKFFRRAIK